MIDQPPEDQPAVAEATLNAQADQDAEQQATEDAIGGEGLTHVVFGVVQAVDTDRHLLTLARDDGGTFTAGFGSMGLTAAEVTHRWVCLVSEDGHQGFADLRWE